MNHRTALPPSLGKEESLAQSFRRMSNELDSGELSFGEMREILGEKGFGLLLVLLSLPSALPVPAPGYSTPFGILLVLLGIQMLMGRARPWLPQRANRRKLTAPLLKRLFLRGADWLDRLEGLIRPRFPLFLSKAGRMLMGTFVILMGTLMIFPVPLTNTAPAIVVFLIGIGLCEEDGVFLIAALICAFFATLLYALVVFLFVTVGLTGFSELLQWFRDLSSWLSFFFQYL